MANQQLKPAAGLGRYGLLAMALTVLGVVLCAGLLYLQVIGGANSTHTEKSAKNQAAALAAVIDSRYAELRDSVTMYASSTDVTSAMLAQAPEAKAEAAARIKATFPRALRVELIDRGSAQVDLNSAVPITFAALDLIRRAETSPFVGPEAGSGTNGALFAAAPITGASGVNGVLFVAVARDYIDGALAGFDPARGLMQINQTIDGASSAVVLEHGQGSPALVTQRVPLKIPGWELMFSGEENTSVIGWQDLLLPLTATLALGLGGIWLAFSRLTGALNKDSQALGEYGEKVLAGHVGSTEHFQIDIFQNLAKAFGTALGNRPNAIPAATKAATRPKRTTKTSDATRASRAKEQAAQSDDDESLLTAEVPVVTTAAAAAAALVAADAAAGKADDTEDFLDIGDDDDLVAGADSPAPKESGTEGYGVEELDNSSPDVEIADEIFRAYDIRGIVETNLTPRVVYWVGRAFAAQAGSEGQNKTVVGRDGRLSSPELAQELIRGLLEGGMNVVDIGQVATPMLYFATHSLNTGTGIMITGSHNPPQYNGLKMMIGGDTLAEERITKLHQRLRDSDLGNPNAPGGPGELETVIIDTEYTDRILDDVSVAQSLKIVVDCGNGVAGGIAPLILQELGCEIVPLYCEVDGTFPNHHPDPADPANMVDLITAVKAEQADLGLAFDGDGDRIGVVTNSGEIIWPDKLMMLFARDIVGRNPGADIIYDVKCSRHLNNLIAESGGRPIMWKTGHSHIKAKLKETGALLAGEFSGHVAFGERWYGFDDAIYTAARLLEIVASDTDNMDDIFAQFPATHATPEIQIAASETDKFKIIKRLAAQGDFGEGTITDIDGLRVDYANGWGLIRASNTSPKLTLRFEADDAQSLEQVQNRFRGELAKVHASLKF